MTLKGHTCNVSSLAFSLDGKTTASGSGNKAARLWSVDGGYSDIAPLRGTLGLHSVFALAMTLVGLGGKLREARASCRPLLAGRRSPV